MSSLALYAAPIESDTSNNKINGNSVIENKRNKRSNRTIKKPLNSKVETMKKQMEEPAFVNVSDDDNVQMGEFRALDKPKPISSEEVNASYQENNNSSPANYNVESFQNNPGLAAEEYYNNVIPNYGTNSDGKMSEKLDYLINLLEEQREQKTSSVTEELILYTFLGVFIIFVLDSFARAGKYTR